MHTYEVIVGNARTGFVRRKLFSRKGMEVARQNAETYADRWRLKPREKSGKVHYSVEVVYRGLKQAA